MSACKGRPQYFTLIREAVDFASDIFPHCGSQMLNVSLYWRYHLQFLHGPDRTGFVADVIHTRSGEAAHFRMTDCLDFSTLLVGLHMLMTDSRRTTWIVMASHMDVPKTRGI